MRSRFGSSPISSASPTSAHRRSACSGSQQPKWLEPGFFEARLSPEDRSRDDRAMSARRRVRRRARGRVSVSPRRRVVGVAAVFDAPVRVVERPDPRRALPRHHGPTDARVRPRTVPEARSRRSPRGGNRARDQHADPVHRATASASSTTASATCLSVVREYQSRSAELSAQRDARLAELRAARRTSRTSPTTCRRR